MALRSKSLFLYGIQVTELNSSLDFRGTSGGIVMMATLRLGFYSLTGICEEIARALNAADPSHNYVATAMRAVMGGLENRVNIATNGTYLDLLFGTGPRVGSSVASLIGFAAADKTGSTSYQGSGSAGKVLIPELPAYNYVAPTRSPKVFGAVNVSTSGVKEAIVFQTQQFWECEFRYEREANVDSAWAPFIDWIIKQRPLEFTPQISAPGIFYEGTLESTDDDGMGLAHVMREMLPAYPFLYQTGKLKFRKRVT
jgi:hypothetical protein